MHFIIMKCFNSNFIRAEEKRRKEKAKKKKKNLPHFGDLKINLPKNSKLSY